MNKKTNSKQTVSDINNILKIIQESFVFDDETNQYNEDDMTENNNLKMKACNGILMLKFGNITDADGVEGVSERVSACKGNENNRIVVSFPIIFFKKHKDSVV